MQIIRGTAQYESRPFQTVCEMLEQSAELYGTRPAFCFRRNSRGAVLLRTYEEYREEVLALALALLEKPAQHIALIGENSYEWTVAFQAILHSASIAVPLDAQLPEAEILSLLRRSAAEVFFFSPKFLPIAQKALEEISTLQTVICLDPVWSEPTPLVLPENPNLQRYSDWCARGRYALRQKRYQPELPCIDPEKPALLLYTSGTTSHSKAVCLNHRNISHNLQAIAGSIQLFPGERLLSVLPLHHTFENTVGLQYPLYCGCTICFTDGLRYLAKNLAEWRVNAMIGVPLLYESIYKRVREGIEKAGKTQLVDILLPIGRGLKVLSAKANRLLFSSILQSLGGEIRLMVSGSAPIHPDVVRGFSDLGIEFLQGYGMTEHSPVISVCDAKHNSIGSVGYPLNGVEIAIDTQEEYRGAIGEIWVRSSSVMMGYYDNPEATAETLDADGWLHTGDLGYLDTKDCLHITGRCKNMIVLGNGKKVFPEECEELLNAIPGVREAFVWGEEAGEKEVDLAVLLEVERMEMAQCIQKMKAEYAQDCIDWTQNRKLSPALLEEIRLYLQDQIQNACTKMPAFKKIKYFLFTQESMLRTASLKIRRKPQLERIHAFLAASDLSLREANGKLMDGANEAE